MRFENWPDGIVFKDAGNSSPSYWPWVTPIFQWEEQSLPIIWRDPDSMLHRLVQSIGKTDFGSTPGIVQWVPTMNPLRFKIPCVFHDDTFQTHKFNVSHDGGVTWQLVTVTERQANDRIHDMILSNPQDSGNALTANTYWTFLQAGGFVAWNHQRNWKRRYNRVQMFPVGNLR